MPKIAVVNDDPLFIELMCLILQGEGYETVSGRSSCESMQLVRRELPDALLLDIVMESWDSGFNLITMLRLHSDTKGIPILICTARMPQDIEPTLQRGRLEGIRVLYKPFELDELIGTISAVVGRPMSPAVA